MLTAMAMLLLNQEERLQSTGHDTLMVHLGEVTNDMRNRITLARRQHTNYHEVREIREEISYNMDEMTGLLGIALYGQGPNQAGKLT